MPFGLLVSIWVMRNVRNESFYVKNAEGKADALFEDIKIISLKWLISKVKGFKFSINRWLLNPKFVSRYKMLIHYCLILLVAATLLQMICRCLRTRIVAFCFS